MIPASAVSRLLNGKDIFTIFYPDPSVRERLLSELLRVAHVKSQPFVIHWHCAYRATSMARGKVGFDMPCMYFRCEIISPSMREVP